MSTRPPSAPYPPADWRLIVDGEADGPTNMAVDEAILAAVVEGVSPPTLRLYAWSPPCLSLGRNQPLTDVDLQACRAAGVDLVRRPTGGRAILHTDELTYSVAVRQSDPRVAGDVLESYRRLSEGLLVGLARLGVEAVQVAARHETAVQPTAVCFETPSDYEIVAGGRKLVGSAQWRGRGGVLQHGALPLHGDLARIVDLLAFADEEREALRQVVRARATSLAESLGQTVPFAEVAAALAAGFSQALVLRLVRGELSPAERALAGELRRSRYSTLAWLERG